MIIIIIITVIIIIFLLLQIKVFEASHPLSVECTNLRQQMVSLTHDLHTRDAEVAVYRKVKWNKACLLYNTDTQIVMQMKPKSRATSMKKQQSKLGGFITSSCYKARACHLLLHCVMLVFLCRVRIAIQTNMSRLIRHTFFWIGCYWCMLFDY